MEDLSLLKGRNKMRSLGVMFVGYLIVIPHVLFSWRDLIWPKRKKNPKERLNIHWNVWLSSICLGLIVALNIEGIRNEFSLYWFLYLSALVVVFLIWSLKFMPGSGKS
jgi:hypothetical protein